MARDVLKHDGRWNDLSQQAARHLRKVVHGPLAREGRIEDLIQEMSVKLILRFGAGLERVQEIDCLDAFLRRMATNVFHAAVGREKTRKHHETSRVRSRPQDYGWQQFWASDGEILDEQVLELARYATSEKQRQYVVHAAMGFTYEDWTDGCLIAHCLAGPIIPGQHGWAGLSNEEMVKIKHRLKSAVQKKSAEITTVAHNRPQANCNCKLKRLALTNLAAYWFSTLPSIATKADWRIAHDICWLRKVRTLVFAWHLRETHVVPDTLDPMLAVIDPAAVLRLDTDDDDFRKAEALLMDDDLSTWEPLQ